jgi:hypothetical protein
MGQLAELTDVDCKNLALVRNALGRLEISAAQLRGGDLAFAAKELQDAAAGAEALAAGEASAAPAGDANVTSLAEARAKQQQEQTT